MQSISKAQIASQIASTYGKGDAFEKSEGSRGGKVIGHTKSGKPIYANSKTGMGEHTMQDHRDAADTHEKEQGKAFDKKDYVGQQHHKGMAQFHNRAADVKNAKTKESKSAPLTAKGENFKDGYDRAKFEKLLKERMDNPEDEGAHDAIEKFVGRFSKEGAGGFSESFDPTSTSVEDAHEMLKDIIKQEEHKEEDED